MLFTQWNSWTQTCLCDIDRDGAVDLLLLLVVDTSAKRVDLPALALGVAPIRLDSWGFGPVEGRSFQRSSPQGEIFQVLKTDTASATSYINKKRSTSRLVADIISLLYIYSKRSGRT